MQPHVKLLCCIVALTASLDDAVATSVNVVGLFPGKAVVSIDNGSPRTISAGSNLGAVKLVSTASDSATFIIDGRRQTLQLGQYFAGSSGSGRASTTLVANGNGHFTVQGAINGGSITFLVDTGASLVMLSAQEATRLGIRYREGQLLTASTANGPVPFYRIKLDSVKVGDIDLTNIDAGVQEVGLGSTALLGMSFLGRTEMSRDGANMVLTKRF